MTMQIVLALCMRKNDQNIRSLKLRVYSCYAIEQHCTNKTFLDVGRKLAVDMIVTFLDRP